VEPIRRVEIAAALAVAADAGMGHPPDLSLATTAVAARLARAAGLAVDDVRACHDVALLRFAGCTSESDLAAKVFGDEVSARSAIAIADFGRASNVIGTAFRRLHAGAPLLVRVPKIMKAIAGMGALFGAAIAHCEVAQALAVDLGYAARAVTALAKVFERFDGAGIPNRLKKDDVPVEVQLATLAHDVSLFQRLFGFDAALEMARERSGGAYSARFVTVLEDHKSDVLAALELPSPWSAALDEEPRPHVMLAGDAIDRAIATLGDFSDLKGATRAGHSRAVSALVDRAAARAGLAEAERAELRWAASAHDLGIVATTASIWDKKSPLTDADREAVRLHPYLGERCLARSPALARVGKIVSSHHERLDGSGYPKGERAESLATSARVLAVADAVQAMSAARPHRAALAPERVVSEIESACKRGVLCGDAARWVLESREDAGTSKRALDLPKVLSERETEVLAQLASGKTLKEVATALGIATKTADNHAQRIYEKIGVTTRAAATLWALRNGLVRG
jgi:HD-GYP domain-containing protein (c-di-GMP phosphodiesterase class II)/DNA-binding CsgD family transcriptional regulator